MNGDFPTGTHPCRCEKVIHRPKLVVLTGGPGGGKTAVLEMARRYFCRHVAFMPEAASIIYGGGFPRSAMPANRRAAQRAIFHTQRAMEDVALRSRQTAVVLCDRGTLDGLAYWPGTHKSFCEEFGIERESELKRYSAVVHVEVPNHGYEKNRIRRESVRTARAIDRKIVAAWRGHPRYLTVSAQAGFLDKLAYAIQLLGGELPECCNSR